jgi:hypothetical protein
MSQNFSNLSQRRSLSKHLAGEAMTELMGALPRGINPGSCERIFDHGTDRFVSSEAACWCSPAEKHASAGASWPAVSQVVSNRLANIHGERKLRTATTLSMYCDCPGLPVQVFQSETDNLTGTQTEPGKQKKNCKISSTQCRLTVAGRQHKLYLFSWKISRYC